MIAINSVSSMMASNAYKTVASNEFGLGGPELPAATSSANFQKMTKASFNRLAHMSPEQILSRISEYSASQGHRNGDGVIVDIVRQTGQVLAARNDTAQRSLLNEASLTELATTTNAARNALETVVRLRDSFMQMWDKIYQTQI